MYVVTHSVEGKTSADHVALAASTLGVSTHQLRSFADKRKRDRSHDSVNAATRGAGKPASKRQQRNNKPATTFTGPTPAAIAREADAIGPCSFTALAHAAGFRVDQALCMQRFQKRHCIVCDAPSHRGGLSKCPKVPADKHDAVRAVDKLRRERLPQVHAAATAPADK